MPHFYSKNPVNSAVVMFHTCVYSMHQCFHTKASWGSPTEAHLSIKHVDVCRIHKETNVTS